MDSTYMTQLEAFDASAGFKAGRFSTALQYLNAAKEENEASHQIDAGREPYLVHRDALNAGLHPFVEVWDVASKQNEDGTVELYTAKNAVTVLPDTILYWM